MILYILFIVHFLAEFTFQSAKLVEEKSDKFKYLIYHSLIYAAIFSLAIFPFIKFEKAILPYIIIVCSHFFIDWIRKLVDKKLNNKHIEVSSFILAQIFHVLILVVIYYVFDLDAETTKLYDYLQQWPSICNNVVIYCLTFITLWDPAAVFVKKVLAYIFEKNGCTQEDDDPQVGRIIGKLERIIIAALILNNQFGAIGFVLTAKSIARYKQLEDKSFAEKYLVGTLTSVLIAFTVTIILKQLLK